MGKIGKCCCVECPTLEELPDISIAGMTPTGDWDNSVGGNICCFERTYEYDEEQEWVLALEDITVDRRLNALSVVEWLKFKQTPLMYYRLSRVDGGDFEECPTEGDTQPDPIDCGTYVRCAVTTDECINEYRERTKFWKKQRDVIVRITKGNVSCTATPVEKWVVQVEQRFWWSQVSAIWGTAFGYFFRSRNTVFETCFSGTMPTGWTNTSSSSGSLSWSNDLGPEDGTITEDFVVKTKTYTTLPDLDTFSSSDADPTDCWVICSIFEQDKEDRSCIQTEEIFSIVTCTTNVVENVLLDGFTSTPCTGAISNPSAPFQVRPGVCSRNVCIQCGGGSDDIWAIDSVVAGPTIDCEDREYIGYRVTSSCDVCSNVVTLTTPTASINYTCGPACNDGSTGDCDTIPFGWYEHFTEERCKYSGGAVASQLSFDFEYINEERQSDVCHDFIDVILVFFPSNVTLAYIGKASLTLNKYAPAIATPQTLVPATRSLTLTTFEVLFATPLVTTPDTLSNTLTTFAPTILNPESVTPATLTLTLTTFAPSLAAPIIVTPDVAGLTLATFAPTIVNPVETTPVTATLVVSAFTPTAATPVVVTPPPLALIIDTETTCELILTTYPPDVIVDSVPCVPTVSIVKSVSPNPITLGNIASWTITVTNTSSCEVPAGIEVSDQLPDETDILYETGSQYGGTSNDSTSAPILTWVLPAIPVGDSVVLGYDTDTLSTGTFTNLATIDAGTGMGQSDSESLTVN
jgi:uncharacterized repeat protein (TIGR01451 family)